MLILFSHSEANEMRHQQVTIYRVLDRTPSFKKGLTMEAVGWLDFLKIQIKLFRIIEALEY